MEEIIAYTTWIDKFKERIAVAKQKALNKREDRQMRNLKNKANGGFFCLNKIFVQPAEKSKIQNFGEQSVVVQQSI